MKKWIMLLMAGLLSLAHEARAGALYDVSGHLPDLQFTLQADDGNAVNEEHYRGSVVLVYFGFTGCADRCPVTLQRLASVLRALGGEADHVRVLFVTIDPAHDTPPVLHSYLAALDGRHMTGLTGSESEIATLAQRYRAVYRPGKLDHGDTVYLFDAAGHARLLAAPGENAVDIEHGIRELFHGQ